MPHTSIPLHVVFVQAVIRRGDTYLLAKRSAKDDQAAGSWAVPGGKVEMELGSGIIENTITREVMEEVGVEITNIHYLASQAFIRSSGDHVVGLTFLADYVSGEARPIEDQEEVRWVTIDEMESLVDSYWKDVLDTLKVINQKRNPQQ